MDLVLQKRTEDFFSEELPKMQELVGMPLENKMEGATTVISPTTGELLAVYGGTQLQSTDFSRATQARRQAGSSLKPLVYTLGFEQKDEKGEYIWKSFSTVTNARRTFKNTSGWRPRNNGEKILTDININSRTGLESKYSNGFFIGVDRWDLNF